MTFLAQCTPRAGLNLRGQRIFAFSMDWLDDFILHICTIPLYYKTNFPSDGSGKEAMMPFQAIVLQPPRCLVLFVRTILRSCSAWILVSGKMSTLLRVLIDTVQKLSAVKALERF